MAVHWAGRGPRLALLLRNFGLTPADMARAHGADPKETISEVKAAFHRLAKEEHPDLAPDEGKDKAADRFVQLRGDFEEAIKLLENGVRPVVLGSDHPSWQQQARGPRPMYKPVQNMRQEYFQHRKEQQFDMQTRVKGNFLFWGGLTLFLMGMREFLVWSAGSCYAWSAPSGADPFYIRRFQGTWDNEAKVKVKEDQAQEEAKPKYVAPKERGLDNFYQKRGISNKRRQTQPRGTVL